MIHKLLVHYFEVFITDSIAVDENNYEEIFMDSKGKFEQLIKFGVALFRGDIDNMDKYFYGIMENSTRNSTAHNKRFKETYAIVLGREPDEPKECITYLAENMCLLCDLYALSESYIFLEDILGLTYHIINEMDSYIKAEKIEKQVYEEIDYKEMSLLELVKEYKTLLAKAMKSIEKNDLDVARTEDSIYKISRAIIFKDLGE